MGESGRFAAVKLGADLIRGIGKWDWTEEAKEVDDSEFGNTWGRSDVGMMSWKFSFSGKYRPDDPYQRALDAYFRSGALIQDLRAYITATLYRAPDVAADPEAGGRVKSQKFSQDKDGSANVSYEILGCGPSNLFGA